MATSIKDYEEIGHLPFGFKNSFATMSCYAATEIDNFILGRNKEFPAVNRLIKLIQNSLISPYQSPETKYEMDTTVALAMNRVLEEKNDYKLRTPLETIDDLIEESDYFVKRLQKILDNPQHVQRDELKELRSLCVLLSEHVVGCEEPLEEIDPESYVDI